MFYIQHHQDRRLSKFAYTAAFRSYEKARDEMITWAILNRTTYYVVGSGKKHPVFAKYDKKGTLYEFNEKGKLTNILK